MGEVVGERGRDGGGERSRVPADVVVEANREDGRVFRVEGLRVEAGQLGDQEWNSSSNAPRRPTRRD